MGSTVKRTKTILQMEAAECGAACLAMVLNYYGRSIPLEKLREDCAVSRDGSSAINILKAAQFHGLKAEGYRRTLEQLPKEPVPCILFWGGNHYVVFEGLKKGRYYINDPEHGRRWLLHNEIEKAFS